ncbi:YciI family protein [Pacificoceanicola onchidii]|uniref:YciI family protein n=1 Tax=Pacificoceanicola onchidii TaxID=2562685 RepID=UPI00197EDA09|nr:YciI family protein [Pacificoceanicola onchidii]
MLNLKKDQHLFVVELTYVADMEAVDRVLDPHLDWVNAQYDTGVFLVSGPKVPRDGGIILAQASSRAALETLLASDPFATADVAEYRVTEFIARRIAE